MNYVKTLVGKLSSDRRFSGASTSVEEAKQEIMDVFTELSGLSDDAGIESFRKIVSDLIDLLQKVKQVETRASIAGCVVNLIMEVRAGVQKKVEELRETNKTIMDAAGKMAKKITGLEKDLEDLKKNAPLPEDIQALLDQIEFYKSLQVAA